METEGNNQKGQNLGRALLRAMRPQQWVKNLFVLAPLVFAAADKTAGAAWELKATGKIFYALGAALLFCMVSGAVYLLNDVCDLAADRAHPEKRNRPIAAGQILVPQALGAHAALVLIGVFGGGWLFGMSFALVIGAYFISNTAYSLGLKNFAYVDVGLISMGFILRVIAGALAIEAPVSSWLLLCTFLLALYLALGKRLHEVLVLGKADGNTRRSLKKYSASALRWWMKVSGGLTSVAFLLYTLDPTTEEKFGHQLLALTSPCIVYGIHRFFRLAHAAESFKSPTERMIRDRAFILNLVIWGVMVVAVLYS